MDTLFANGIRWIVAVQSLGAWLEMPARFLTFLGSEDFFFMVLPLIYWSIDARTGLQVGLILSVNNYLVNIFKMAFADPRPYWVSDQIKPYVGEPSFGIPSGHAQHSAAIWGTMAYGTRKRWAWVAAVIIVFLIGFSRFFLGVHFVHDLLAGWLIGALSLWMLIKLWDSVGVWLSRRTLFQQIGMAFFTSLLMILVGVLLVDGRDGYVLPQEWVVNALRSGVEPDPISIEGILTPAGTFFGLTAGAAWIASRGGYQTSGPLEKRVLRYVVGLIGILILWMGLGEVFPRSEDTISYILRFVRYALVGFWVVAGAPWLFFHFKLADPPKM